LLFGGKFALNAIKFFSGISGPAKFFANKLMGVSPSRTLPDFTVEWYRTKIEDPKIFESLHRKSDVKGFIQAGGFLGTLLTTAFLALRSRSRGNNALTFLLVGLYGVQANFLINGMHELGHGTVFRTKLLNNVFLRIISFLGWLHPDMFFSSHLQHHRYTLWFPDYDQVVYSWHCVLYFP
jgi:fatty acid desaturase